MKKVCAFIMCLSLLSTNNDYINVDRSKLNYEVLSIQYSQTEVIIEGWATASFLQHFYSSSTHGYELDVVGQSHSFSVKGSIKPVNLNELLHLKGYPQCKSNEYHKEKCNYEFDNVGFEFRIPLQNLKVNEDYKLYLKLHAKQTNMKYRIPIFYVDENELIKAIGDKSYTIFSSFKHSKLKVYMDLHYARVKPTPHSEALKIGDSCSLSYGNTAYFKQHAVFDSIKGIDMYNNLVTYFKVEVGSSNCVSNRRRVIEQKGSNIYAYLPSTAVNYLGEPTTIKVREATSKPILMIEDVELFEKDPYNPMDYVDATDIKEGNLFSNISVINSTVNMNVPGSYQTCYKVYNSKNVVTTGCGQVIVHKRPRKHRFVSIYSIHNTSIKLWERKDLKDRLHSTEVLLIREHIKE